MITREIKSKYSCRRRRDFVTWFAIIFFFIIVALELYLILWVPIQLQREGVLQKHVAKEQMGKKVDHYRREMRRLSSENSLNKGEIVLAQDMLDLYANYIRMYQDKLELAEILEISSLLDQYGLLTIRWEKGDFAFRRNEISLQQAQEIIEKKNGL
ncbi:MAG: hypothetical protein J5806_04950 [Lentisphaeria bacterium]|nr:hypothetical protein [Lentisphaeria bacterium]